MIHRAADLQATAEMKANIFIRRGKLPSVLIFYVEMPLNTTEEGAIAPKALVFLGFAINIRFQLSIRMVDKGKKRV